MDSCKGFNDWFICTKCPDICTQRCPIEGSNAFEYFAQKINLSSENLNLNNERDAHESLKQS